VAEVTRTWGLEEGLGLVQVGVCCRVQVGSMQHVVAVGQHRGASTQRRGHHRDLQPSNTTQYRLHILPLSILTPFLRATYPSGLPYGIPQSV
jgi:hypothetical protein